MVFERQYRQYRLKRGLTDCYEMLLMTMKFVLLGVLAVCGCWWKSECCVKIVFECVSGGSRVQGKLLVTVILGRKNRVSIIECDNDITRASVSQELNTKRKSDMALDCRAS